MKTLLVTCCCISLLLCACGRKNSTTQQMADPAPKVLNGGTRIIFPDSQEFSFFITENVSSRIMSADITAPAKISATVLPSKEGASQNIILFENPELAGNYTLLIQHAININQIQNINIRQKKIELERIKDLQQHGAATGKDLLDAQLALSIEETNLANERAAIIEHEAKLKAGGFNPEMLRKAPAGTAYIICDIPENQVSKIREGSACVVQFTSFPNEQFRGKIDDIADMIDNTTRMIKLRISLDNTDGRFKAGMFATVSFSINEGTHISVSKNALVTVQGKNYVFAKSAANTFDRKEVSTGVQVGDRVIIYTGLKDNDAVAVKGVMQLKGLSFGY